MAKAKKSTTTAKSYVYPVFETFDGMRCPRSEGGVKEKSVQLMVLFTNEKDAEVHCIVANRKADEIKEALEDDTDKYERKFSYKKTSLIRKMRRTGAYETNYLPEPITIIREGDTEPSLLGIGDWKSDMDPDIMGGCIKWWNGYWRSGNVSEDLYG